MLIIVDRVKFCAFDQTLVIVLLLFTELLKFANAAQNEVEIKENVFCPEDKTDLIFLIDSSTSVERRNFTKLTHLIGSTVDLLNIGPDDTRVGIVQFTGHPKAEFDLAHYSNRTSLIDRIGNLKHITGVTHLGQAIQHVADKEFIPSRGERPNVANVLAILSDGLSQDDVSQPSMVARARNIEPIIVAIGKFISKEQLLQVTGGRRDRILRFRETNSSDEAARNLHHLIRKTVVEKCSDASTTTGEGGAERGNPKTNTSSVDQTTIRERQSVKDVDLSTTCENGQMKIQIKNGNPFTGRIFVKGEQSNPDCSWDYRDYSAKSIDLNVDLKTCGAVTKRSTNPEGVFFAVTLIMMKHPILFQIGDHAWRLQCHLCTKDLTLDQQLEVEPLTTAGTLEKEVKEKPDCMYTIRRDTVNGPLLRWARLGSRIVHRWECESSEVEGKSAYAMRVHSCYLKGSENKKVLMIDADGCPTKDSFLKNISYDKDRMLVSAESSVVSLPDTESVQYECQVSVCIRGESDCEEHIPPKCSSVNRLARSLRQELPTKKETTLDIASTPLLVLDVLESNEAKSGKQHHISHSIHALKFAKILSLSAPSHEFNTFWHSHTADDDTNILYCWPAWTYATAAATTGTVLVLNAAIVLYTINKQH
ncbi:Cuticlin-1 [Trichinella pseudospiralis]|uniref:Cuticlin-1 n=1 Tax=Trichinella pseudospiralis TaxID=6337 RepID=A0A0V1F0Z5_TRIPS|nr:Cuticlin-1 [Trichinella pseudospiralis]